MRNVGYRIGNFKLSDSIKCGLSPIFPFCDCGKDYTIEDLLKIKQEVTSYLREIIQNIEEYIDTEAYYRKD